MPEVGSRHENRTKQMTDDTSYIFALKEGEEMRGEQMECDIDEQREQESEKVKTIPDPGQRSKREREEHEATHGTVQKLVRCVLERKMRRHEPLSKCICA